MPELPESERAESGQPEPVQPEAAQPDATQPEAAQPDTARADVKPGISRRAFFAGAATSAAVGATVGVLGARVTETDGAGAPAGRLGTIRSASANTATRRPSLPRPSRCTALHQAGIQTPPQDHLVLMVFDVTTTSASELQVMLAKWSAAIAEYTKGEPVGAVEPTRDQAVPGDTGEASGMGPYGLTVTVGFAPSMFDGRFGWAKYKPAALNDLPIFAGDTLTPQSPAATSSCRPARTTPRWRTTPSATWPAWRAPQRRPAGPFRASDAHPAARARRRRAT